MNHKRKRPKNLRGGCLMCKSWKVNGFRTERLDGERFSDHRRREFASIDSATSSSDGPVILSLEKTKGTE